MSIMSKKESETLEKRDNVTNADVPEPAPIPPPEAPTTSPIVASLPTPKTTEEKYGGLGLTGLANLGNTCFINSTIQCLSHTYELNDFLEDESYKKKLSSEPDTMILVEYDDLRRLMWSENCTVAPRRFLSHIRKISAIKGRSIFTGFAQNDLPEFLLFFIDCFHNSLKREVVMNIDGASENTTDELAVKCYTMMKNMYEKEYSEMIKLFFGIHVSELNFKDSGKHISITPEPFFVLDIPIPNKKLPSLTDCFDLYCSNEEIDKENGLVNEDTGEKEAMFKKISFFSLPNILVVSLKRFTNLGRKNNVYVDAPLTDLCLSKYVVGYDKLSYNYDLYGVCNHSGSPLGGHYTANIRNANGKWYNINDTFVQEIKDTSKVISNQAYCLFYRKKK